MTRKFISLILSLSVLLCSVPALAQEKNEKTKEIVSFLQSLDMLSKDYDNYTIDNREVTKGEFVDIVAEIFAKDGAEDNLYFHDISKEHWAYKPVSMLVSKKLISVGEERFFYPEEIMKKTNAARIFLKALGFGEYTDKLTDVEVDTMCNNINVYEDVSANETLCLYDLLQMIYNTLVSSVLVPEKISNGNITYATGDKTYLETYYSAYYEEGILQGYDGVAITTDKIEENEALINGLVYECEGINLSEMLGKTVKYLYHYDEDKDERTLLFVTEKGRDKELELYKYENWVSFDTINYTLSYVKDSGSSRKKISLPRGIRVVYNGELVAANIESVLSSEFYSIKLIQSAGSGEYDIAIIRAYDNYIVNGINAAEEGIYDKLTGNYVSLINADRKIIASDKGEIIPFSDIKNGDIVSVFASLSGERIEMQVCQQTVSVQIRSVDQEQGYMLLKTDDMTYRTAKIRSDISIDLGSTVVLYLDSIGFVADVRCMSNQKSVGYILKATLNSDNELTIKLFDMSGKMLKANCADKVRIDDVRYMNVEATYNALGGKELVPQIISYETNKEGLIKTINTAGAYKEEGIFYERFPMAEYAYRASGHLGNKMYLDNETVIFAIPADAKKAADDEFAVKKKSELKNDKRYFASTYAFSNEIGYEDYVVIVGYDWNAPAYKTPGILVTKITKSLNDDDEVVDCISGYQGATEVQKKCTPEVSCSRLGIQKGDYISVSEKPNGEIEAITVIYSPNAHSRRPKVSNLYDHVVYSTGYANDIKEGIVRIGINSGADFDVSVDFSGGVKLVYDTGNNEVSMGTVNDVIPYNMSQIRNSFIVMHMSYGVPVVLVIYK